MANICLGIIQARSSSKRLPGKVLKQILAKPMIVHQIERIRRIKKIDHLVVATSIDASDDELADVCCSNDVDVFRGSLDNVLERFYYAAIHFRANTIVRMTADCPLIDPQIVDKLIGVFFANTCDYASNTLERTFPDGMDVEIFNFSSLRKAHNKASNPYQREHVTPFIYQNPRCFTLKNYARTPSLGHLRLTVDTEADFKFVEKIFKNLYPSKPNFQLRDIINLLEKSN